MAETKTKNNSIENHIIYFDSINSTIDKSLPTISISEILGMLSEPFDRDGVAQKTFDKHYNNEDSQYYRKTVDEIIAMWEAKGADSLHYGRLSDQYIETRLTKTDNDLELWKLDNNYDYDDRLKNNCNSFDDFYNLFNKKYQFVDREQTVYLMSPNKDFLIKGRYDARWMNTDNGNHLIVDWKTSGTIDKTPNRWTGKLLGPASIYPSLNWYIYTMQVYFYKYALLHTYLQEGTDENSIDVAIVDLPGQILESTGKNWEYTTPAFQYDEQFMERLFEFGMRKKMLLESKS